MTRSSFEYVRNISVQNLLLDVHNARIRSGADQADCIARILRKSDQFLALATDIAINGLSTAPILIEPSEKNRWIVWDGNRRVTALKLLNDPALCPVTLIRKKLEVIAARNKNNVRAKVDCMASSDHAALLSEVVKRHSGSLNGVGQLDWLPFLRTVFLASHDQPEPNRRAALMLLWGEEHGVEVSDSFPITTVTRFLSQDNLKLLGFDATSDEVQPNVERDKAIAIVQRIASDFDRETGSLGVNDVFDDLLAKKYISVVRASVGLAVEDASTKARPVATGSVSPRKAQSVSAATPKGDVVGTPRPEPGESSADAPPSRPRQPRRPTWDRNRLFRGRSAGFLVPAAEHPKAYNVLYELGKLSPKDTPLAVAALFRMLVELSTTEYYRRNSDVPAKDNTHRKIAAVARHMAANGRISEGVREQVVNRTTEAQGMLQYNSLNAYMHDVHVHPDAMSLNTLWDELDAYLAACWSN